MSTGTQALNEILDDQWIRRQFVAPLKNGGAISEERTKTLRYQTSANQSIGGSGIGNSRVLNPPPGINRFADTPRGATVGGDIYGKNGHLASTRESSGVYYHEFLEKPMDIVHIRPGVCRFNPLTSFWTNAFSPDAMEAAEYGWIRKAASFVGELLGFVITAPLKAVGFAYNTLKSLVLGPNANKYQFYYLSPAPLLFWRGLDDMMMAYAIKIGFTGSARFSDTKIASEGASLPNEQTDSMKGIMRMMPGVMDELDMAGGYRLDTITLAHRYSMMHNMRTDWLKEKSQTILGKTFSSPSELKAAIAKWEDALQALPTSEDGSGYLDGSGGDASSPEKRLSNARAILLRLNSYQASEDRYRGIMGNADWKSEDQVRKSNQGQVISDDGTVANNITEEGPVVNWDAQSISNLEYGGESLTDFQSIYKDVAIGGLDFFSLAVDKVETGSISISNTVGPSNIESMFNGSVSAAKGAWFSASNGNIGDGVISDTIEGVAQTGKAFINGLANNITGGVQSALFGGKASIDIGDVYQSSSTQMPTHTYSFTSQAISGHPISKLKMMFPIFALLRCGTPISAGPRSFMSPFVVSVIQKGRNVCNMGMITDVQLDWGGEAGWDVNDIPCEIKASFTVTNLDKNFHIPISGDMTDLYNDDGQYESLLNILAGVSPTDLDRSFAYQIKSSWAKSTGKLDRFFSLNYMATAMGAGTRSIFEGPISMLGGYVKWRE